MSKPTYFIPPTFHNPPDGPLRLGQLIVAVDDPANALDTPEPFLPHHIEVYINEQTVVSHGYTSSSTKDLGLFAKAVQAVAVKAGVAWSAQHHASILSHIERLEVRFIQPDDGYVKASLLRTKVQDKLRRWVWQKRAFMITGLCIAHPSSDVADTIAVENARKGYVGGEAEARVLEGLGSAGARGHASAGDASSHFLRLTPRQPFVYAFQLRTCRYGRRKITNRPATDGAVMSEGDKPSGQRDASAKQDGPEAFQFVYDEVAEEDLSLDELGYDGEGLTLVGTSDEITGEPCNVIMSTTSPAGEASSA
ncbi:uncharacterized protein B0H64DRAFT_386048 [Chaetomium fimeti]|uniref:Uncharacterized protein n=1 Tax=Chaetomium fimeti TaxID=1854472 RepID=A0AAE0LV12_9PEZI|nr:hypothetical protein B0H64DRAFT_386048 [Chaetomium fimeti]